MVALGGGAVSYEPGAPEGEPACGRVMLGNESALSQGPAILRYPAVGKRSCMGYPTTPAGYFDPQGVVTATRGGSQYAVTLGLQYISALAGHQCFYSHMYNKPNEIATEGHCSL